MIGLLALLALVVVFGPQLWARHVLRRYGRERPDLPGTGAELARHLLRTSGLTACVVAQGGPTTGDHYDPERRAVVLSPPHHNGRSLTAAVVAAHEVGHAIQHHIGYRPLAFRQRLVRAAVLAERVAPLVLAAIPVLTLLARAPGIAVALLLAAVALMAIPVLAHLVTLPVELDASFRRALPILAQGYLDPADLPHARRILTACALTYLAAALMRLLDFARWWRVFRR